MVQTFPFAEEQFFETGKMFPPNIEDYSKVAFHGTSSAYSPQIERDGFLWKYCPIQSSELEAISDSIGDKNPELSIALKQHATKTTRLGFAGTSAHAAIFSLNRGGQIVKMLRTALTLGAVLSEQVNQLLKELEDAAPVVYAVDMSIYTPSEIRWEIYAFQAQTDIPLENIIGKVILPASLRDVSQAVQKHGFVSNFVFNPGYLAQRLKV